MRPLSRALFRLLARLGRRSGRCRPHRLWDAVGRRAWPEPAWRWVTNRYGDELHVSPHYHIDRDILAFGRYDPDLHSLIEEVVQPGMVCADVGANLGEVALHLARRCAPDGRVFAFEPVPSIHTRLVAHVERNGREGIVEPVAAALSDTVGEAVMAFPEEATDNQGLGSLTSPDLPGHRRSTVSTTTLDAFVSDRGLTRLDFVKLDVEGAEHLVLEGGREALARFRPVLVAEVCPAHLAAAGLTTRSFLGLVAGLGYDIHEVRRGGPGRQIDPEMVSLSFDVPNVLCRPRSGAAAP